MDEQLLPDLLRLRGSVVAASDEFFAAKENLIKPEAPVFVPGTYGARGQVYDGWETRRRRGHDGELPDRTARDWVIVRLGVPGVVRAVVVDTAFFTGNYPQACSVDACALSGYPDAEELTGADPGAWHEIVPRALVTGDARHVLKVSSGRRFSHLRLNIFPDGGVARLRVHGEVSPDPDLLAGSAVDGKVPRLGILVEVEQAYTQCSKAVIRSDLWNPERHIDRSELPRQGEILRSLTTPDFDADEYERERAARYARRQGLY